METAGSQSITATDTVTNSITGSQSGITVNAAGVASFVVSGFPNPATAGTAGSVTVTAKDAYGNTATGYTGTVKITSSDGKAVLPANAGLSSGTGSFYVTLETAGSQSITATDTETSPITGSQSGITVNAAGVASFVVSGFPNPATAGTAGSVTVTAKDAYGNTATGYTGTVKITSSDGKAVLPANAGLSSGTGSFPVTLETAGSQSITATDTVTNSITGSQSGITVNAAGASKLVFTAGTAQSLTAGVVSPTAIVVERQDAYGNPVATGTSEITVTLSTTSSGGVFYSDNTGKTVITSIAIAASSSDSGGFYYKDTVAGSPTVTGASSSLTSATTQLTINAADASKLAFVGAPFFGCWCDFWGDYGSVARCFG